MKTYTIVERPYAGASITVEVGRDTIDPQGLGSDEDAEACAEFCDALGDAAEVERDACCDDRSRSLHAGRMHGADECARAIRARGAGGAR